MTRTIPISNKLSWSQRCSSHGNSTLPYFVRWMLSASTLGVHISMLLCGFLTLPSTAAIVMYMYLYSLAVMDHPCTLGDAVCHQKSAALSTYTQPRESVGSYFLSPSQKIDISATFVSFYDEDGITRNELLFLCILTMC